MGRGDYSDTENLMMDSTLILSIGNQDFPKVGRLIASRDFGRAETAATESIRAIDKVLDASAPLRNAPEVFGIVLAPFLFLRATARYELSQGTDKTLLRSALSDLDRGLGFPASCYEGNDAPAKLKGPAIRLQRDIRAQLANMSPSEPKQTGSNSGCLSIIVLIATVAMAGIALV